MNSLTGEVSVLGFGVQSDRAHGVAEFWADINGWPRLTSHIRLDVHDVVCAALVDAGFDANHPGVRVGIFCATVSDSPQIESLLRSRFPGAVVDTRGLSDGLEPIVRAVDALNARLCDIAVAVATDAQHRCAIAACLGMTEQIRTRNYATIHVASSRGGSETDHIALLRNLCAIAGVELRDLTLVDVAGGNVTSTLKQLAPVISRGEWRLPHCAVGPVLDPDRPALGMQSFCCVALSIYQRLRPAVKSDRVERISKPFYADLITRPWIERSARRAAMLSKSIDGLLSAILFEEPARSSQAEPPRICDSMDCELFLVGARDRSGLVRKLCDLEALKPTDPSPPLWTEQDGCRAAVIAADRTELFTKTRRLRERLESKNTKSLNTPDGIYFREQIEDRSKTAFLMPGQGSQYLGMLSDLCIPIPQLQVWFERLEASFDDSEPCPPSAIISSPAVGLTDQDKRLQQKRLFDISGGAMASLAACLGMHDLLIKCGVQLDAILGYSNGENAALIASGFWYFQDVDAIFLMLDRVRKDDAFDNSKLPIAVGETVAVNKAPRETLQQALGDFNGQVYLALDNCPDQVVLFGERSSLAKVVAQLSDAGAICIPLPFDRGHHTPVYEPHANSLRKLYKQFVINRPSVSVYSCAAAAPFPEDLDAGRELAASQWTKCVRFRETVERMYADGLRTFVEVGPSSSLTGFVHSCLRRRPHTAIACNIQGRPALNQLLNVLGILFVEGHSINLDALHPRSTPAKEPASAEPTPQQTQTAGLLAAHFRLMQDFLASQARVHALFTNSTNLPPNELAPPVSNALIGHKLVRGGNTLSGVRLFHTTSDPFLLHHAFGRRKQEPVERREGLPVIPFTISMEMLAEAACSLAHRKPPRLKLKNVRAARWLAVDDDGLSVGIEAGPSIENPAGGVRVTIFEQLQNRAFKAFEGIVEFETGAVPSPLRPVRGVQTPRLSAEQFNERLFHGPLFLSLRSILAVADNAIEARAIVPSLAGFFAENSRPKFLLPAPLLDTAGQLVAYWLGEQGNDLLGLFPFELEEYVQFAPPPVPGSPINVRASISLSGQTTDATIDFLNEDGALLARLQGLKMRAYGSEDPYLRYVLAGDPTVRLSVPTGTGTEFHLKLPNRTLFDAQSVWTRLLARLTLSKAERDIWARIPGAERVRWLTATILSKEAALAMSGERRLRLTELISRSRGDSIHVTSPSSSSVAALIRIHQTGDELCASSVQHEFVTAIEERVYA